MLDRIRQWRPGARDAPPEGLLPADKLAAQSRRNATAPGREPSDQTRELIAQRDRLSERFTIMQADLGGVFYEMAIRDHVRMDVLTRKAAELQRIEADLEAVERELRGEGGPSVAVCPLCGAPRGEHARFCWSCGHGVGAAGDKAAGPSLGFVGRIARTNGNTKAGG